MMFSSPDNNLGVDTSGFSLIEMLAMIVVVGILVAVAMQSMGILVGNVRQIRTEREMERLAFAITGNPSMAQDGIRADFGYVGDNGALPASLADLITNPGLSTWRGPYLNDRLVEDTIGYRLDEWGQPYIYTGGVTISSNGNGSPITRRVALSTDELLYNNLAGKILDALGTPPDTTHMDSITVILSHPDGLGGTINRTAFPVADGAFQFDSIPVGRHRTAIVYTPDNDTLIRYVTVLPRNKKTHTFRFATPIFESSSSPTAVSVPIGETGAVMQAQTGGGSTWHSLTPSESFADPVVIMQSLSANDQAPCHLRVRSVTGSGFEWQIEEWDYLDGNHSTEQCPYLVLESGAHTLEDGSAIEAGLATTNHNWTTIAFSQPFSSVPVVLTAVTSDNDAAACVTRIRNVTSASFQARLQEEEDADGIHGSETISWVAIETGVGTNGSSQFLADVTPEAVDKDWYPVPFAPAFGQPPILLVQAQTTSDIDPCGTRFQNLSAIGVELKIEEEKSRTGEQNHGTEAVGYLAWSLSALIMAAP